MESKKKIPDFVECSKCRRRLDPRDYMAYPDQSVSEHQITRIVTPAYPSFSVQCSNCGQYTVFPPYEKKQGSQMAGLEQ